MDSLSHRWNIFKFTDEMLGYSTCRKKFFGYFILLITILGTPQGCCRQWFHLHVLNHFVPLLLLLLLLNYHNLAWFCHHGKTLCKVRWIEQMYKLFVELSWNKKQPLYLHKVTYNNFIHFQLYKASNRRQENEMYNHGSYLQNSNSISKRAITIPVKRAD